jgi:hypothetical protein
MADNEYFAHFAPDGTTPWEFFQSAGYVYAHAGENLAIHFTDSAEVVEAWMLSPAHRKNIVDPKFREIGVGTARGTFDGYDTVYVVQLFGTPAATPTPTPTLPVVVSAPAPVVVAALPAPVGILPVEPVAVLEPVSDAVLDSSEPTTIADGVVLAEADPVVRRSTLEPTEILPAPVETAIVPPVDPVLITTVTERGVLVETQLATSSGLAVATMVEASSSHAGATMASIVTRPNLVLQILYGMVASLIVVSLLYALIVDVRRLHYVQVSYSLLLLVVMGGLWFLHTSLTSGAVIV